MSKSEAGAAREMRAGEVSEDEAERLASMIRPAWEADNADDAPPSDTILESVKGHGLLLDAYADAVRDREATARISAERMAEIPGTNSAPSIAESAAIAAAPQVGAASSATSPVINPYNGAYRPSIASVDATGAHMASSANGYEVNGFGDADPSGENAAIQARKSPAKAVVLGAMGLCVLIGLAAGARAVFRHDTPSDLAASTLTPPAQPSAASALTIGQPANAAPPRDTELAPPPEELPAATARASAVSSTKTTGVAAIDMPLPRTSAVASPSPKMTSGMQGAPPVSTHATVTNHAVAVTAPSPKPPAKTSGIVRETPF